MIEGKEIKRRISAIEFPLLMVVLVCSWGTFLAYLFKIQFTFGYLIVLVPLIAASYVSSVRFYRKLERMDRSSEGNLPANSALAIAKASNTMKKP
jgi:hypothetical protein